MKRTVLIAATALAFATASQASVSDTGQPMSLLLAGPVVIGADMHGTGLNADDGTYDEARRGRGRGRGGDDRSGGHGADDNGTDDSPSGSGRRKPRIPGGSGCDDAGDIAEHPECSG